MSTAVTPDIVVHVQVRHLPERSTPAQQLFLYRVSIENRTDDTWQLLSRHWQIMDGTGRETVVSGEGVVGEQPVLAPGARFSYESFVPVESTPGRMGGHYVMQDAWGNQAQVPIPTFDLNLPGARLMN